MEVLIEVLWRMVQSVVSIYILWYFFRRYRVRRIHALLSHPCCVLSNFDQEWRPSCMLLLTIDHDPEQLGKLGPILQRLVSDLKAAGLVEVEYLPLQICGISVPSTQHLRLTTKGIMMKQQLGSSAKRYRIMAI